VSPVEELHETYTRESGLVVTCTMFRLLAWDTFIHRKFTREHLITVCRHLQKQIKAGRRSIGCLAFHVVVCDLDFFEEQLAEANALARKPQFSPGKAQVLRDTQRPAEPQQEPPQSAATLIERLKLSKQLRDWSDKNL